MKQRKPRDPARGKKAFTLIELLVVIAIISILAAMLLPSLSKAKGSALRISCLNQQKQMVLAVEMYLNENQDAFPPRSSNSHWPDRFYDGYGKNIKMLVCPSDRQNPPPETNGSSPSNNVADASPRTYIINGWNDYYADKLGTTDWPTLDSAMYASPIGIKASEIVHPSDTIVLGEKKPDHADFYMDLLEPNGASGVGNDFTGILEQSEHDSRARNTETGGSNYTFADGSARFMKVWTCVRPLNLWAVTDTNRLLYASP